MKRYESIAVMLIMLSLILQFGFTLAIRPYESRVIALQECFNLLTQLYLSYLMLLFTDFTPSEIQISAGGQFLYTVLVNIGANLLFGVIPPSLTLYRRWKTYYILGKRQLIRLTSSINQLVRGKKQLPRANSKN